MTTDSSGPIPIVIRTADELRVAVATQRTLGKRIGLVPTMGALHDGHLSLVQKSNEECDFSIVSIFVNPAQFGPQEDLDKYPRTLPEDLSLLGKLRVPIVFAPTNEAMYPAGFSTFVDPPAVAAGWEGDARPGHFRGVATVVLKLFNLVQADVAYFGQKDYQQSLVIRRMVDDLGLPIAIRVCPIVREPDGLAMSSRNRYLSGDQRAQSLAISRVLEQARQLVAAGERDAGKVRNMMRRDLEQAGHSRIAYVEVVDPETLMKLEQIGPAALALIATHVGKTRLLDNCFLR